MTTENITICKQNLLKAYREAEPSQREFMKKLFGTEAFTISFNVMERVKTFEDAVQELGEDNPLVKEYDLISNMRPTSDLLAFLKLRIIVAALNEGWEPQFTKDEYRWYPWFYLYTKEEYEELDEKDKPRFFAVGLQLECEQRPRFCEREPRIIGLEHELRWSARLTKPRTRKLCRQAVQGDLRRLLPFQVT